MKSKQHLLYKLFAVLAALSCLAFLSIFVPFVPDLVVAGKPPELATPDKIVGKR